MTELSTTEAKQRPILFSTPMVKAILEGRKTQTRRIIKDSYNGCWTNGGPHPCPNEPVVMYPGEVIQSPIEWEPDIVIDGNKVQAHFFCSTMDKIAYCLYGKPGDILYVRETWCWDYKDYPERTEKYYFFKADTPENYLASGERWYPSIHMPRTAARIFLKITGISVERLQDITQEDAQAEGIEFPAPHRCPGWKNALLQVRDCYKCPFKVLWNQINGGNGNGWDTNPWIWKISFQRIETPTP